MNNFVRNNNKYLGFIRTSTLLIALLITFNVNAADGVRFGLTVTPLITWMKPDAGKIVKGKVRAGVEYGLIFDVNVAKNYSISSGITISMVGGNFEYQDASLFKNRGDSNYIQNTDVRLKYQYLNIPILFKLKTNEIGYFHYFGTFGILTGFNIKARADVTVNGVTTLEKENIGKRKGNTNLLVGKIFNLGLQVGGGFEYSLTDNTSLLVGIFYNNGFLNVVDDGDDDKILVHAMGLRVGILF